LLELVGAAPCNDFTDKILEGRALRIRHSMDVFHRVILQLMSFEDCFFAASNVTTATMTRCLFETWASY
jgi:hypothetical protein